MVVVSTRCFSVLLMECVPGGVTRDDDVVFGIMTLENSTLVAASVMTLEFFVTGSHGNIKIKNDNKHTQF